ncbi:MAG: hypothetical protein WCF20_08075 [Methylovirgula sp.]
MKPLARRGLLKVTIDPTEKRARRLCLTPEGRAALAVALPLWKQAQMAMQRRIKKTSPDRLRADLRALC